MGKVDKLFGDFLEMCEGFNFFVFFLEFVIVSLFDFGCVNVYEMVFYFRWFFLRMFFLK